MQAERGVYREYGYIKILLNENPSAIYPILFRGDKESSIPTEFDRIGYFNFSKCLYTIKNKEKIIIERENKPFFTKLIGEIINKATIQYKNKDIYFDDKDDKYNKLLFNTKADGSLPKQCMIKIDAYDEIFNQRVYFIVGRKGSGKSTLLEIFERFDPDRFNKKYKTLAPINAEYINMEAIYELIHCNKADRVEIPIVKLTSLFWEVFITLQSIYIVSIEEENFKIKIDDPRQKIFHDVSKLLRKKLSVLILDQESTQESISSLAIEIINDYINNKIFKLIGDESKVISSFQTNLNVNNIIEDFLGNDLYKKYVTAISQCTKKVLISLDGFDTKSEDFRRIAQYMDNSNPEKESRMEFEALFFRSLMEVTTNFKSSHFRNSMDTLCKFMDFCIVLPQDRLDQIKGIDRDSAKKKYSSLYWDAYDLLKMLVLRLEMFYEIEPDKQSNYKQRFENILKLKLPKIPLEIEMIVDGNKQKFDLFNYMLRLSFWRPREILLHFARLLSLSDKSEFDNYINVETIKQSLTAKAKEIIQEEFIKEYQHVFRNLSKVLHSFDTWDLISHTGLFCEKLSAIKFDASFAYDCTLIKNKLLVLYQLGVIGLYYESDVAREKGLGHHICFFVNEGLDPIQNIIDKENYNSTRAKIIFNPILGKFLSLHINVANGELIGDYDMNYIEQNHLRKAVIRRF